MKQVKVASIKTNFIYNTAYQIMAIVVPLITTPYLSRVLGAEYIGIFSYAFSVVYYFGLFAMLGVNNYGNRSIAAIRDDEDARSKTFWSIYFFQIVTSLMMFVLYVMYIAILCDDKTIGWIMIPYIISCGLDINWFFFGIEQFKLTTIRNIFIKIFSIVGIFIFVKKPTDVYLYALIYVLSQFLSQVILWVSIGKYARKCKIHFSDITQHIKPNIILFIPLLAISLYKIMDKIMLGAIVSKVEVGYYESSERVIQVPVALINSLGTVMLPRISNLIANNERKQSEKYLRKSISFAMFLSFSMGFGIMAVAKEFVPVFYGQGFEKCVLIFQVLLPSCFFLAFANVIRTQYLIPNKMDKEFTVSIITGAMVNFTINLILIPKFASIGAGVGTLCAEASVCLMQCTFVRKKVNLRQYLIDICPFFIAGLVMYFSLQNIVLKNNGLVAIAIKIFLGIVIYGIVLAMYVLIQKKWKKSLDKD